MAFLATPSSFLLCKRRFFNCSPVCELKFPTSASTLLKLPTIPKSIEPQRLILYIDNFKSKLWSVTPQPLKDFPFQDSGVEFLNQMLLAGKEALKSYLLVLYICSVVSHVVYSVSRNKELLVPLGLYVGCVATNFVTEISKELFPFLEEHDARQHLVVSCCLFTLMKIIWTCFVAREKTFFLHVADGGLMQILWLWKSHQMSEKYLKSVNTAA